MCELAVGSLSLLLQAHEILTRLSWPHQLLGLVWPLWKEFGWDLFKSLGADQAQRTRYRWVQVLITLLKFCWFFGVGFTMQVGPFSLKQHLLP